ncbi:MAG: VWA domain-containing protein [Pseudomonadota bacterium]
MTAGSLLTWGAGPLRNLLWALPVVALLFWWAQRRRTAGLARIASAPVLAGLAPADLGARRTWQAALLLLGLASLIIAAARPQLGFQWRDVERHGIDLAVVVDVSRSMDAEDVSPSRMERARREVLDLCTLMPADRIGLVVFAAGAYPRVPLTLDHDALLTILKEVDTATLQAQGTSLPAALDEALKLLTNEDTTDKAIVLLSDGEVPVEDEAVAAADRVGAAGVNVFVMGVGTSAGAPIPLEGGGFKKDRSGQVVMSKLNEPLLRRLAARAGGAYVRSMASDDDIAALVDQIRGQTQGELLGVHREKVPNEHFQWPLGAGLVLFVLGLVVGLPSRARSASVAFGLLLVAGLCASPAQAGARQDGLDALAAGQYEQAVPLLMDTHVAHPDDLDLAMSLGQALLLSGRPNEAERVWEQVAERSIDTRQRALARYDMGHAAYQGGRLTEAREHFMRAAEMDRELEAASKNAEAVAREIAARTQDEDQKKPCDNPQQGEQGQQGQQGQDQNDQDRNDQDQDPQSQDQQDNSAQQQPAPPSDGTRPDGEEQQPMEGDIQPAGGEQQQQAQGQAQEQPLGVMDGDLEAEQAAKLLDGVEEGSPRVVIQGRSDGDQDW